MFEARPLRIVILDCGPGDAELLVRELRQADIEGAPEVAGTEADFLASLDPTPDLILAVYQVPDYCTLGALRALRSRRPPSNERRRGHAGDLSS